MPSPSSDRRRRQCTVCGAEIQHAEKVEPGLCGPCGVRLRLSRLPPAGHQCVLCGERRRRSLTIWALTGEVVCHTCDFYLREMRPWPEDLSQAGDHLRRERRLAPR